MCVCALCNCSVFIFIAFRALNIWFSALHCLWRLNTQFAVVTSSSKGQCNVSATDMASVWPTNTFILLHKKLLMWNKTYNSSPDMNHAQTLIYYRTQFARRTNNMIDQNCCSLSFCFISFFLGVVHRWKCVYIYDMMESVAYDSGHIIRHP